MCVTKYIVSHTKLDFTQFFLSMTLIEKTRSEGHRKKF